MNASGFLMSLIVVGLATLGSYGQEVRAEQPVTAAEQPVEQPVKASGNASEKIREADKATGELLDEENAEHVDAVKAMDNALSWTMRYP